jgi:hypothetical protein
LVPFFVVGHGVVLPLDRLFAVLANLFEFVPGHNVELSRHVGHGAEGKQRHDGEENN